MTAEKEEEGKEHPNLFSSADFPSSPPPLFLHFFVRPAPPSLLPFLPGCLASAGLSTGAPAPSDATRRDVRTIA